MGPSTENPAPGNPAGFRTLALPGIIRTVLDLPAGLCRAGGVMVERPDPYAGEGGLAAGAHEQVRGQHRDERSEDYVEAIYRLRREHRSSRVVDLQNVFGVSHVTVIRAVEKMETDGLVQRTAEGIDLTREGTLLAEYCFERHQRVEAFLRKLGVSAETAAHDAEGIEHHLSEETLGAMKRFLRERR